MKRTARTGAVLGLAASLVFGITGPAFAKPTTEQLVAEALVSAGENTPVVADPTVTVNEDTADIATDWGALKVKAQETESVVREQAGGAQILSVLDDGDVEARFELELPEQVRLESDGAAGYDLVATDEQFGTAVFGHVDAPWAVDANGNAVATSYELQGDTLVQRLHGEDIAFPVVADPTVNRNCGIVTCTWYISVLRTRAISDRLNQTAVGIAGGLSAAAACAVIAAPSGAGAVIAGTACAVASAVGGPVVVAVFNDAKASGDCATLAAGARLPLGRVDLINQYCDYV